MISFTITNKHRPKATVLMLVNLYGKQYRKSIGVGVPVKFWNEKKKCAKVTAEFDGNPVNAEIDRWEEVGKKAVKYFTDLRQSPSSGEFSDKLAELSIVTDADTSNDHAKYFCDYFEKIYIPRYSIAREKLTVVKYTQALRKLRDFELDTRRRMLIININIDFYNKFQRWFYDKGYSRNYLGNIIKIVKQVYREARVSDRLHDEYGTDHRDFVAPKDSVDNVYLDLDELNAIYALDIDNAVREDAAGLDKINEGDNIPRKVSALKRARCLFLIGCYTGLRVSDFSRLRSAHIGTYITIKTAKTGASVIIPIHPVVRSILNRGYDLNDTISDQKLNGHIKELCRLAGITNEVLVNRNIGGKNAEQSYPKYKLVSSHTARRSFATNAYKAGVPTIAIMKITGHTKESTFLKYIKVSAEENADILSRHPFFARE